MAATACFHILAWTELLYGCVAQAETQIDVHSSHAEQAPFTSTEFCSDPEIQIQTRAEVRVQPELEEKIIYISVQLRGTM